MPRNRWRKIANVRLFPIQTGSAAKYHALTATAFKHVKRTRPPISTYCFTTIICGLEQSMVCPLAAVVAVYSLDLADPTLLCHARILHRVLALDSMSLRRNRLTKTSLRQFMHAPDAPVPPSGRFVFSNDRRSEKCSARIVAPRSNSGHRTLFTSREDFVSRSDGNGVSAAIYGLYGAASNTSAMFSFGIDLIV